MRKIVISFLVMLFLCSCSSAEDTGVTSDFFAMDTYMSITGYGESAESGVSAAKAEIERLDRLFSISDEESDVWAINNSGGSCQVSPETVEIIGTAVEICHETGRTFDITLYPVSDAWGFYSEEYTVPSDDKINELLKETGSDKIKLDGNTVETEQGVKIDLGGIAKGYATEAAVNVMREQGVESAILSLGGNIYALGHRPDGKAWNIAIQDPFDSGGYSGIISVSDMAVITSGSYQRYFEAEGKVYHHIIDPATGKPADNGLVSVTVVCKDPTMGDALSTALFVMGKDKALAFWQERKDEFDVVFVEAGGEITVTGGLSGAFSSEYNYETVY